MNKRGKNKQEKGETRIANIVTKEQGRGGGGKKKGAVRVVV